MDIIFGLIIENVVMETLLKYSKLDYYKVLFGVNNVVDLLTSTTFSTYKVQKNLQSNGTMFGLCL